MNANNKNKVIVLSDHALSTSGVGTQTRHLINGLLEKNKWTFRQFGAALKHASYETTVVNDDFIIKPIDGFGSPEMIRVALATEKPDALFIFTDPRFFIWLFEIEDEVHQICPIAWWHVWDNYPFPEYNSSLYQSTDLINCHSHLTYSMISEKFPEKTNFVPHSVPDDMFFKLDKDNIKNIKSQVLGPENVDKFVAIWINRNAKRKRPSDLLEAWRIFMEKLKKEHGHQDALLIMHTDPMDQEGPNLFMVSEMLGVRDSVFFSNDRLEFDKMNALYNISDCCINVSYAEGFGLSTLESMMTGTPIVAVKTGGLTRQVIDHRDGSENGAALDVDLRTLVGSQSVPYIYEDYASNENIARGIMKIHDLTEEESESLSKKVLSYVESEFSYQNTIDSWDRDLDNLIQNWEEKYERWKIYNV
jgi:glycosyltransferase involved in cell wall biosynthesis